MIIGYSRDGGGAVCATSSVDTWNPSDKSASFALSNGNKTATATGAGAVRTIGSHTTGKWYVELAVGTFTGNIFDDDGIGLVIGSVALVDVHQGLSTLWVRGDGLKYIGGVSTGVSIDAIVGQTIGLAIDLNAKRVWARNDRGANGWTGPNAATADPVTGTNGMDVSGIFGAGVPVFVTATGDSSTTDVFTFNQTFTYAMPSGFCAW